MSARRLASLALLLAACSGSKPVVNHPAPGGYKGPGSVDEDLVVAGIHVENDTRPHPVSHTVGISSCNGRLVFSYTKGCSVPITWADDGTGSFDANYPCAFLGNRGNEADRILGGTLTPLDAGFSIALQLRLDIDQGSGSPKSGGTATWRVDNAVSAGLLTEPDVGCDAKALPPGDTDYSALVGCAAGDFVDASADGATREIRFGPDAGVGNRVEPKCLQIAKGQSVRWVGDFSAFPLGTGKAGALNAGASPNPLMANYSVPSDSLDKQFDYTGDFIFHAGQLPAMAGMVRVR